MQFVIKISLLSCIILLASNICFSQNECLDAHSGLFSYGKKIRITIVDEVYTEESEVGVIQSKINWTTDCEFNMTFTQIKVSYKNYPDKVGDVLEGKIVKIKKNKFLFEVSINGRKWKYWLKKVKP